MLIEKEVIGPGTVWYNDLKTGAPRKSVITDAHVRHWHEQGNKMLSLGLTVPVPCEHDFQANPMTPAEKLANNAGWVKEYKLKGNRLFSIIDVQDDAIAKKLPTSIKWTSPWFTSFVDGAGRKWDNVIAHLALTTRPRVIDQAPFPSIAAALSAAVESPLDSGTESGYTLSKAGMVGPDKPLNAIAFSLYSGVALSEDDVEEEEEEEEEEDAEEGYYRKLLYELLKKLNVPLPEVVTKDEFKTTLAKAAELKMTELASAAKMKRPAPNPVVQEHQPMYMSLDEINKIPDETMKNIALSLYSDNAKLQAALEKIVKETGALRDAKLTEETTKRKLRVDHLGRLSPKVKGDLEAMLSLPAMALSIGDSGTILDPMSQTLSVLEKGLADMPRLLQTELTALSVQPHPTDAEMSQDEIDHLADSQARMMGCAPEQKKAS